MSHSRGRDGRAASNEEREHLVDLGFDTYGTNKERMKAARRRSMSPTGRRRPGLGPREASFRIPMPFPMPANNPATVDDGRDELEFKYLSTGKEGFASLFKGLYKVRGDAHAAAREACAGTDVKTLLTFALCGVAVLVDGFRPVSLVWAKDGYASYPFNFSVWILVVKAMVVFFSVIMFMMAPVSERTGDRAWGEYLRSSVYLIPPSVLYVVSDALNFTMLEHISASSYAVLKQSRLIIVSLMFRFLLGRYLSQVQWIAIVQLMFCAILFEANKLDAPADGSADTDGELYGIGVLMVKNVCDSLAVVWMDRYFKLLSDEGFPYPLQQVCYAVYGFLFGVLIFFQQGGLQGQPAFHGWGTGAYVSAALTGCYGVLTSLVLRYLDSIVKMFNSLLAVITCCYFDYLLFGKTISPVKAIAICLILLSVSLYKIGTVKKKKVD